MRPSVLSAGGLVQEHPGFARRWIDERPAELPAHAGETVVTRTGVIRSRSLLSSPVKMTRLWCTGKSESVRLRRQGGDDTYRFRRTLAALLLILTSEGNEFLEMPVITECPSRDYDG